MKRRHALITSATVSVVVLGGAVAAAAWNGAGLLGFASSDSGEAQVVAAAGTEPETESMSITTDGGPRTSVEIRVIEDRIVVKSATTVAAGGADVLRVGGSGGSLTAAGAPSSTLAGAPGTTTRAHSRDDDDEYDHEYEYEDEDDDEYEYEYEDDDEHEDEDDHEYGHDEYEDD